MELIRKDIGEIKSIEAGCFTEEHERIDVLIEWLQNMKQEGATHIHISGSKDYEGAIDEIELQAFMEYTETLEQEKERKKEEQVINRKIQESELNRAKQIYEALKRITNSK